MSILFKLIKGMIIINKGFYSELITFIVRHFILSQMTYRFLSLREAPVKYILQDLLDISLRCPWYFLLNSIRFPLDLLYNCFLFTLDLL